MDYKEEKELLKEFIRISEICGVKLVVKDEVDLTLEEQDLLEKGEQEKIDRQRMLKRKYKYS